MNFPCRYKRMRRNPAYFNFKQLDSFGSFAPQNDGILPLLWERAGGEGELSEDKKVGRLEDRLVTENSLPSYLLNSLALLTSCPPSTIISWMLSVHSNLRMTKNEVPQSTHEFFPSLRGSVPLHPPYRFCKNFSCHCEGIARSNPAFSYCGKTEGNGVLLKTVCHDCVNLLPDNSLLIDFLSFGQFITVL